MNVSCIQGHLRRKQQWCWQPLNAQYSNPPFNYIKMKAWRAHIRFPCRGHGCLDEVAGQWVETCARNRRPADKNVVTVLGSLLHSLYLNWNCIPPLGYLFRGPMILSRPRTEGSVLKILLFLPHPRFGSRVPGFDEPPDECTQAKHGTDSVISYSSVSLSQTTLLMAGLFCRFAKYRQFRRFPPIFPRVCGGES